MLLASCPEPAIGDAWIHQLKVDGCRAQLRVVDGQVELRTRKGRDATDQFPELAAFANVSSGTLVVDGELCCFGADGAPNFELLRTRLRAAGRSALAAA